MTTTAEFLEMLQDNIQGGYDEDIFRQDLHIANQLIEAYCVYDEAYQAFLKALARVERLHSKFEMSVVEQDLPYLTDDMEKTSGASEQIAELKRFKQAVERALEDDSLWAEEDEEDD